VFDNGGGEASAEPTLAHESGSNEVLLGHWPHFADFSERRQILTVSSGIIAHLSRLAWVLLRFFPKIVNQSRVQFGLGK